MISSVVARSVIAARTSGATSKPSCAAKRAARIIRSGSSAKDSSGAAGVMSRRADEVVEAAVHVDELEARQPDRHGVDREVAAHEVALEACRRT